MEGRTRYDNQIRIFACPPVMASRSGKRDHSNRTAPSDGKAYSILSTVALRISENNSRAAFLFPPFCIWKNLPFCFIKLQQPSFFLMKRSSRNVVVVEIRRRKSSVRGTMFCIRTNIRGARSASARRGGGGGGGFNQTP